MSSFGFLYWSLFNPLKFGTGAPILYDIGIPVTARPIPFLFELLAFCFGYPLLLLSFFSNLISS